MEDGKLNLVVANEKEWRKVIFKKIDKIESRVDHLEIKIATYSGIICAIFWGINKVLLQ